MRPSPADDVFPRGELYLACGLALTLRLGYLVGVAHSPFFFHPVVQSSASHPYAWFLAALNGLLGGDPLLVRLVQILLDTGSVFLLGATAHEIWGRRAAVFTAQVAALYGSLIYFTSDLSPATFSFALVCVSLYGCARMARMASRGGILISGVALALAVLILVQGGADEASAGRSYLSNLVWVWNRHKVPCGAVDQAFFASFLSPIFRLPWLLSFALVGPIALVTAWKERRRAPLLGGYLLVVTLALAATPVCDRTRLALLPAVLPLVGRGVDEFLLAFDEASARAGAWLGAALAEVARKHGGILIALVVAAAFVNVPPAQRPRPPAGLGWWIVARAYIQAENPREAQAAFDRAERSGFGTSAFYAEWGRLEHEKRIGILAAQHLLTAIQLDPRNGPAHESLGDVYATREDFDQAGQEYAVAAGLTPARAAELDTRAGEAYLDAKSPERARAMFQKALRETPGYEAARAGLTKIQNPPPASRPARMFEPLEP